VSKTLLVARREFLATVLTKAFLLGIILPPAIMGVAFTLLPLLMNQAPPKTVGTVAIIDQSPDQRVARTLEKTLTEETFKERKAKKIDQAADEINTRVPNLPMDDRSKGMVKSAMASTAAAIKADVLEPNSPVDKAKEPILSARVRDHDEANPNQRIALLVIPKDAVIRAASAPDPNHPDEPFAHYQFYVAPKLDIEVQQDIIHEVDQAIIDARLAAVDVDPAKVRSVSSDPRTDTKVVTAEGERKDSGVAQMFLPVGFLMLLWISVLVGGQGLLMSTVEEKSSRVMEVLLSAVSPLELMLGKILGQMGVAASMMAIYGFTGVAALTVFSLSHLLDPILLVYSAIYFVIAFFLMASMMAAVGSVVNDIREAQALMQPVMIVMVIPMVLWLPISRNPNGMFAQVVSFLPPISPFVMVVRLAGSEKIPFWQVPATIAIGVASMAFMAWAAAKIFRIGVLMYGKPPNFKTLVRWVRMA
jgi:ABC-2 type transport system permease protein